MTDTGRKPEHFTVEEQRDMLLRFAKRVRDMPADPGLADDAEELVMLFGDPDSPLRPQGVIRADVQYISHWVPLGTGWC